MITRKTLSGLALAVLAIWTIRMQWQPPTNPSLSPSMARMQCISKSCGKVSSVQLRSAKDLTCAHCSGRLAPLTQCPNCPHQLILAEDLGLTGPTACPECKKEVRRED